jgi:type IV secretion system protein VirB10
VAPAQLPDIRSPMASSGPVLVLDTTRTGPLDDDGSVIALPSLPSQPLDGPERRSSTAPTPSPPSSTRLQRRATTLVQGTLIPAVLETALDSTRPGNVRAIVSRDISGFDGSQVLIPRGSRVFGTYQADLAPGQNRALVRWTRLVRPDGVAIALDSPAADRQGRIGIRGRVDNHYLERFGSALLQSTMNIGSSLASRSISSNDSSVIVALPGSTQNGGSSGGTQVQPTLRVEAGVTVTVFVSQDLELPAAGRRR